VGRWIVVGALLGAGVVFLALVRTFYRSDRAVSAMYRVWTHIPAFGFANRNLMQNDQRFRIVMTAAMGVTGVLAVAAGILLATKWA
jgi:hypothetical protein